MEVACKITGKELLRGKLLMRWLTWVVHKERIERRVKRADAVIRRTYGPRMILEDRLKRNSDWRRAKNESHQVQDQHRCNLDFGHGEKPTRVFPHSLPIFEKYR